MQAQAARLGVCEGFSPLRRYLWPEPRAGECSPAAEVLQAGSAVARGMADAPGLVTQGSDWISNFICGLHWDPFLNMSAPVRSLCTSCSPSAREFLQKFFEQEFCRSCTSSSRLNKALKHLINFKHTNSLDYIRVSTCLKLSMCLGILQDRVLSKHICLVQDIVHKNSCWNGTEELLKSICVLINIL